MASFPRRSARLTGRLNDAPQWANGQSSIPQLHYSPPHSSVSTTKGASPTNKSLNSPPPLAPQQHDAMAGLRLPPLLPHKRDTKPPLPSPSASNLDPFFSRTHSQSNYTPSQSSQQEQSMFGQQQNQNPPQLHPHSNSIDRGQGNLLAVNPGQLPPDFLAEAARRAQIACLMRDMGDVSL
ncbi:hypothetical protein DV737_g1998, partial [Chaetothyriales sp. CBS 132003]